MKCQLQMLQILKCEDIAAFLAMHCSDWNILSF